MKEFLLPNHYKKIGISTGVLAVILWLVTSANPEVLSIQPLILTWIFKMAILLSLLAYIFSKEKIETARIAELRINNIWISFLTGISYLVVDTFVEIFYAGENLEIMSGYQFLMLVIFIYMVRFYIKKNIKTVVRA